MTIQFKEVVGMDIMVEHMDLVEVVLLTMVQTLEPLDKEIVVFLLMVLMEDIA